MVNRKIKDFILIVFFGVFLIPYCFGSQQWNRHPSTPILQGSQAWEVNAIQEVRPYKINNSSWIGIYTGGTTPAVSAALGFATSTDGINWSKSADPIIGDGFGDEAGLVYRPNLYVDNGVYYVFYTDNTAGGNMRRQQSSDGGTTWTTKTTVLDVNGANKPAAVSNGYANSSIYKDGSTYHLMVEAHVGGTSNWNIFHATSTDLTNWTFSPTTALSTLQVNADGMYGGPKLFKLGGVWNLWYHSAAGSGTLPTDIYHATSTDLSTWTKTPGIVISRSEEINTSALGTIDQVSDVWLVENNNEVYSYYSRVNNNSPLKSNTGLAVFTGPISILSSETSQDRSSVSGGTFQ